MQSRFFGIFSFHSDNLLFFACKKNRLAPNVQRHRENLVQCSSGSHFFNFSNPRDLSNPLWPKLVIPCDIANRVPGKKEKRKLVFFQ